MSVGLEWMVTELWIMCALFPASATGPVRLRPSFKRISRLEVMATCNNMAITFSLFAFAVQLLPCWLTCCCGGWAFIPVGRDCFIPAAWLMCNVWQLLRLHWRIARNSNKGFEVRLTTGEVKTGEQCAYKQPKTKDSATAETARVVLQKPYIAKN